MGKRRIPVLEKLFGRKRPKGFRPVYFGIRVRFLGMLSLVMIIILLFIAVILYQHQKEIIADEKSGNAQMLVRILGGPAELYLDRVVDMTDAESKLKLEMIEKEASNFRTYNPDITKILIIDEKGIVRFSTEKREYGADMRKARYFKKTGTLSEGQLGTYDPMDDAEYMKNLKKGKKPTPYLAIISPVFLSRGFTTDVLADYRKYYDAYHDAKTVNEKERISRSLYVKYKETLGPDFDPVLKKKKAERAAENREKKKPKGGKNAKNEKTMKEPAVVKAIPKDDGVVRAGDIDFIFHRLFTQAMSQRGKSFKLSKNDQPIVREEWLVARKKEQSDAKDNDLLSRENEIATRIRNSMTLMADGLDRSRMLGRIAVIFNTEKIERERERILSSIIIPVIGPVRGSSFLCALFVIIAIAFFIVLSFMVRNLKRLEGWAMDVAHGNLGKKIEIRARDEIGRLGDAFNHMLDGIIEKYHLQKFVSDSTKSMIGRQKSNSPIDLGITGRRELAFMFSDVRGFTAFSERNDPETVIGVLNFYLELQSRIIKANRGDIDDYVGDAIMAHFSGERRIDTVISNAIVIMKAVRKANAERAKKGEPVFEIGIGIHGGEVVVGNIGSEFRMDFACVGDAVNLSSRLCSSAGPGEIVVSKELFAQAGKKYPHKKTAPLTLKGKKEAVEAVKIVVE